MREAVVTPLTATEEAAAEGRALLLGVRGPTRTRPCACGRGVRADPYAPAAGLRAHQRTNAHRDWRAAREYADYLEQLAREKVPA